MALLRLPASAKTPASAIVLSDGSFVNEDCSDSYLYPTCGGTPDDARAKAAALALRVLADRREHGSLAR